MGLLLAVLFLVRAQRLYEATATLRIEEQQESVAGFELLQALSSGNQVATEIAVLQSRTLARQVVDSLGLAVVVQEPKRALRDEVLAYARAGGGHATGTWLLVRGPDGRFAVRAAEHAPSVVGRFAPGDSIRAGGTTVVLASGASRYAQIALDLRSPRAATVALSNGLRVVRPSRESNVVELRYRGSDPSLVQAVPNALAVLFIESRRDVQSTEIRSTIQFLREQLDTLALQLAAAEDTLGRFRREQRVVDLAAEATQQVNQAASLQAQRTLLEAERAALAAVVQSITQRQGADSLLAPSPFRRLIAFPSLLRNQAAAELLRSLAEVENQRALLLQRRLPADPDVQVLTARVRELEEQLRAIALTYLQGLANQVEALERALGQYGARLATIPERELRLARLRRRPQVLEELVTLLETRLAEAEIAQAAEDPSVRIVDLADRPTDPVSPNRGIMLAAGLMGGLFVGLLIAALRALLDRRIYSRRDAVAATHLPVVGALPQLGGRRARWTRSGWRPVFVRAPEPAAPGDAAGTAWPPAVRESGPRGYEAFRLLRTNLLAVRDAAAGRSLLVTSARTGEGKTFVTSGLAAAMAEQGTPTVLVDADLRRGQLHEAFGLPREPGLADVLRGDVALSTAMHRVPLDLGRELHVLTAGRVRQGDPALLGSAAMADLLSQLTTSHEAVLIDVATAMEVADAAVVSSLTDGTLLVLQAGASRRDAAAGVVEQLRAAGGALLGVVLNGVPARALTATVAPHVDPTVSSRAGGGTTATLDHPRGW